jgi:hypothetical protein
MNTLLQTDLSNLRHNSIWLRTLNYEQTKMAIHSIFNDNRTIDLLNNWVRDAINFLNHVGNINTPNNRNRYRALEACYVLEFLNNVLRTANREEATNLLEEMFREYNEPDNLERYGLTPYNNNDKNTMINDILAYQNNNAQRLKYLKYKNKYLNLKNQIGGNQQKIITDETKINTFFKALLNHPNIINQDLQMSNNKIKIGDIRHKYPNINQVIINLYTYQKPNVYDIYIKYDNTDNFLKLIVRENDTDTAKLYKELIDSWEFL